MRTTRDLKRAITGTSILALFAACSTAGDDSALLDAGATGREATLACEDGKGDLGEAKKDLRGVSGDKFTLNASWCYSAQSIGKLRVLFIVDRSGSMQANDPARADGCGRLDAAKALVADLKGKMQAGRDEVEIAAVKFDSAAELATGFVPLATFEAQLTPEVFCEMRGSTNYALAFAKAEEALASAPAGADPTASAKTPVVTYFVTDGMPSDPLEEAVTAAESLRTKLKAASDASVLNAVFLGSSSELPAAVGQTPLETLARVTGDANLVKNATDAAQLAAKLTEFKLPVAGLDKSSLQVSLKSGDQPAKTQACEESLGCKVEPDAADAGRWRIVLTFPLSGSEGQAVPNVAEITGKRTDGSAIRAKATVNFTSLR